MEKLFDVSPNEYTQIFDCDYTRIPEAGTLVAIDTASSGLVNMVTTGNYSFRKQPYDVYTNLDGKDFKKSNQKGSFLVSVEVKYLGSDTTNSRFLDDLYFPVMKREIKS